jgi:hypothetical protein
MLVKDGQLCWSAVAMGAASLYETLTLLKAQPSSGVLAYLGLIIGLMLISTVLAAGGAVFSTPLWALPAGTPVLSGGAKLRALCGHYKVFLGSFLICAATAFAYTVLHFGI